MDKETLIKLMKFNDLEFFMKSANKNYIVGDHTQIIMDELMKIIKGEVVNLIVSLPPRGGKSMLISEHFPAFFLGHFPEKDVIITGYGDEIASKFSTKAREIYNEFVIEMNGVYLSKDTNAKDKFKTMKGGVLKSAGLQGALTGYGADLLIVDDPFKNRKEAQSQRLRDDVWEAFQANAWSRRAPGASTIIVQTRWHDDDLVGRIKRTPELASEFKIISVPALSNYYETGSFFPERFTKKDLLLTQKMLGRSIFEALYQQNPVPDGGELIMKKDIVLTTDYNYQRGKIYTSWDLSQSDNGDADYTVCQIWYNKSSGEQILLNQIREKMTFPKVIMKFKEVAAKYPLATHLVEGKTSGKPLIQMLKNKIPRIIEINPSKSKVMRVEAIASLFESKTVVFLKRPYVQELILELTSFPNYKHDDQVDALSQYLNYITEKKY